MCIENQTVTENLKEWHNHHLSKGLEKFVYDGIVNETLWKTTKPKICFFLKEAYLKEDEKSANLCEWLSKNDIWRMWWVVSDWIYAIEKTTPQSIPVFDIKELDNTENANQRVRSSAIINIKKSNGKSNSNYDDLLSFAKNDSNFIRKQFNDINPDVIVCGNTRLFFEMVFGYVPKEHTLAEYRGFSINHDELSKKGYFWAGETLIIDFCHPSNRFMRMGKYYALCALYQAACIEKTRLK